MSNNNGLRGLACPNCGNGKRLAIEVFSLAVVTEDDTELFSDFDWVDTSYCECPDCWHHGTIADFRPNPQPSTITNKGETL